MQIEEATKKRNARPNSKQLDLMISYMETNKDFREGKLTPLLTKADRKRKWKELAEILNAEGAAVKTPEQWRKCWHDQKGYAKNKAAKIKIHCQTSITPATEILTPVEERILRAIGYISTMEESVGRLLNMPPYISTIQVPMIEDALVIEREATLPVKEEIHSDESNTVEEAVTSEVPETELSPGPSLPETNLSEYVAINVEQQSNQPETGQSGFVPIILKLQETEKSEEKQVSSKELGAVLENLKQQNDLLKRIAVANEQIAHACMIIATNTEDRGKETSLQTELISDINQTLKYILKRKSNEEFF